MKKGGFDPIYLFNPSSFHYWKKNSNDWHAFADYRKDLCCRLKTYFLDFLSGIRTKKQDFELMLTVIDVSLTPELSDYIGENTFNALKLQKQYNLTLQVEDQSNCWGATPDRYDKMGKSYRKYVKVPYQLLFDCNVVDSHVDGYGGFPSVKPSGEEIRQIAYNMSLSRGRPGFLRKMLCINGISGIFPPFWPGMPNFPSKRTARSENCYSVYGNTGCQPEEYVFPSGWEILVCKGRYFGYYTGR